MLIDVRADVSTPLYRKGCDLLLLENKQKMKKNKNLKNCDE
jgi:hypothetical protein